MKTDETFVGEKRVERERVEMERVTGWDGGNGSGEKETWADGKEWNGIGESK